MREAARPASSEDLDDLLRLVERQRVGAAQMRGGELWILRSALPEPVRDSVATYLRGEACGGVVGLIDGAAVGYGLVHVESLPDGRELGVVDELYVEPEARRVGIGQLIIDQLLEWCRRRGCAAVEAIALPGDRQAKNLFERSGLVARAITVHRSLDHEDPPTPCDDRSP